MQELLGRIEILLRMRATLDMLMLTASIRNSVYHVKLPVLIAKITQFPRKEEIAWVH